MIEFLPKTNFETEFRVYDHLTTVLDEVLTDLEKFIAERKLNDKRIDTND